MKRDERLQGEFERALEEQDGALIEPTPDEARNGWTAETLTAYLAEQKAAQSLRINPTSALRHVQPQRANGKYSPHRWRR